MILYFNSPFFGQMALPQVNDNTFSELDGGKVEPLDGSNWLAGSYLFPIDALPHEGSYVKILEGVGDGLGGTFDFGIRDQGDGEHWELGRWYDPSDLDSFVADKNNIPYTFIDGNQQIAASLHFGFRCYGNDTQNPAQLAWWISPGDMILEEWDILNGTWLTARDTSGLIEAFDKTADDNSILGHIVNAYQIWAYHAGNGNSFLNTDVSLANGGAGGYQPRGYRGGDSSAESGSGDYGRFGESLGMPELATSGIASCGLVTEYHTNSGELAQLAHYLTDDSFIASIKKTWSNPLESIISLFLLPTAPDAADVTQADIILGGVNTGISSDKITSSTFGRRISFGSINLKERFEGMNWLDFEGTKVIIYMPYVGYRELDAKDVMNTKLSLDYNIDFLTGDFVAVLRAQHTGKFSIQRTIMQERGNCSVQVPLTSQNYTGVYQGILNGLSNLASGNVPGAINQVLFTQKISTQRCGSIGGMAAAHGEKRAFLKIEYPDPKIPRTFKETKGQPLYVTYQLSDLDGFTVADFGKTNLSYMSAAEREEVRRLFREGVYL